MLLGNFHLHPTLLLSQCLYDTKSDPQPRSEIILCDAPQKKSRDYRPEG